MWEQIGTEIILGIIGVVISGLGALISFLINKYVKNNEARTLLNELHEIVKDVVQDVYQTYVDTLKKGGMFDADAQKKALDMALEKINASLSEKLKKWLDANYADAQAFIKTLIESAIFSLKNTK